MASPQEGDKPMSILLSDEKIAETFQSEVSVKGGGFWEPDKLAKAAAIHAVQYLEGECDKKHLTSYRYNDNGTFKGYSKRKDCDDCMKQIKQEIGI
jgi:hypothetical protein